MKIRILVFCVVLLLTLAGCGGGGGDVNNLPVASAGGIQNVQTGTLVTLDGSASNDADSDPLTYSWAFTSVPVGSSAVLSDTTAVQPTFTADFY